MIKLDKCDLCEKEAVDSMDFESGNNAEIPVMVALCQDHLDELDKIGYVFEGRYADKLNKLAYEQFQSAREP